MIRPKLIKNLYLNGEKLQAIGRKGTLTNVFARQGYLDSACCVYSLMMLLILHKKLDWNDLTDEELYPKDSFAESIRNNFLDYLIGMWRGGHELDWLSDLLNCNCFHAYDGSKVYYTERNKDTTVSRHELHKIIKAQLDKREPLMLAYSKKKGCGHAVVVIGYSKEKGNKLRLYCLDPSGPLGYLQVWNNIIDLDYFSLDDESFTDYNHRLEDNVLVNKILIIKDDKPKEPEYPF